MPSSRRFAKSEVWIQQTESRLAVSSIRRIPIVSPFTGCSVSGSTGVARIHGGTHSRLGPTDPSMASRRVVSYIWELSSVAPNSLMIHGAATPYRVLIAVSRASGSTSRERPL
jgi:hypothetical protein